MKKNYMVAFGVVGLLLALLFCLIPGKVQANLKADKVVVLKSDRLLILLKNGEILKTYKVSLGRNPVGQKMCQGDSKTPEGLYYIDSRNAHSKYYKSLHISYPNAVDIEYAKTLGTSPGGGIMIHGLPAKFQQIGEKHRVMDWTRGCIAVTNAEIEEIWMYVADGTPIEINP
jgi:murein L,D-transpeptidase YafK